MKVKEKDNGFTIETDDNEFIGEVTYVYVDGTYRLNHTYVDASFQGQGYARTLVDLVCEKARKEKRGVVPLCSYADRLFEQEFDKYNDLINK
ncbi:MAG: GNAT family N-acetyltransferase [Erysipelotrichales bacterium]